MEGAASALPCLNVVAGPATGLRVELGAEVRFGRDENGAGALHGDPWLSPAHAAVRPSPEGYFELEDLGSIEGTKVNGTPLRAPRELHFGDVIELGSSRIVVGEPNGANGAHAAPEQPDAPRLVPASYWHRWCALFIDGLVNVAIAFAAGKLFLSFVTDWGTNVVYGWLSFVIAAQLSYRFLSESICGQTLGKRAMNLRVVRVDRKPLDPQAVMTRTVLLLLDELFFIGVITVLLTNKRRRIGDLAAGTMVVPASTPHPGFRRRDRDLLAFGYPLLWCITIAVVLRLLGPGLQPCTPTHVLPPSTEEGSCIRAGTVLTAVDAGHKLSMSAYDVTLERTAVTSVAGDRSRVALELSLTNKSATPFTFADGGNTAELLVSGGEDGSPLDQMPATDTPRRFPPLPGSILSGATAHGWLTFIVPRWASGTLTDAPSALLIGTKDGSSSHVGEIRLWLPAGAAGVAAVRGLGG